MIWLTRLTRILLPSICAALSWGLLAAWGDRNIPLRAFIVQNMKAEAMGSLPEWAGGLLIALAAVGLASALVPRTFYVLPGIPPAAKKGDPLARKMLAYVRGTYYLMLGCCVALVLALVLGFFFDVIFGFRIPARFEGVEKVTGMAWLRQHFLVWWLPNIAAFFTFYFLAVTNKREYLGAVKKLVGES